MRDNSGDALSSDGQQKGHSVAEGTAGINLTLDSAIGTGPDGDRRG